MRKISLFILFFVAIGTASYAQVFTAGKTFLTLGYGIGSYKAYNIGIYNNNDVHSFTLIGPLYLKYEYAVEETLGIGINAAYESYKYSWNETSYDYQTGQPVTHRRTDDYYSFSIIMHGNIHFLRTEKLDAYIGAGAGYRKALTHHTGNYSYDVTAYSAEGSPLAVEGTIGARLKFSQHLAAYSEVGLAKSAVQVGLTAIF